MKHIIVLGAFLLVTLPLWAGSGLSNVVRKEIHHAQGIPAGGTQEAQSVADSPAPAAKQEEKSVSYTKPLNYPYTIHLSSFENSHDAARHVERMRSKLDTVFITKIDLGASGVWYRVDYGIFPTIKEAVLKLQELKAKGLVEESSFVGGSVSYAIELELFQSMQEARSKAKVLSDKGINTYVVKERENLYRLLCGAYPDEKSAAPALKDLLELNYPATVKKR